MPDIHEIQYLHYEYFKPRLHINILKIAWLMATTEIQAKLGESTKKHDDIRDCKLMESDSTTNESNVVTEFCNLLEESRQLFQSLRWHFKVDGLQTLLKYLC